MLCGFSYTKNTAIVPPRKTPGGNFGKGTVSRLKTTCMLPEPTQSSHVLTCITTSSGLMRRLGIDNDEKRGSRAKPQTILVRILQHNPIVFLSGGKFCKAQMDSPHTIHNKSQPQIGNGNTKHQRKTSAFSNHAILKTNKTRLRHSTIMFMHHVL